MAWFRALLGSLVIAIAMGAGGARAEFWDAATCDMSIRDTVEHLESDRDKITQAQAMLEEAQRKGDTTRVAQLRASLQSFRVDGIKSKLKRLDTVDYVYCDTSLIDPDLIARADAVRPLADEVDTTFAAEGDPQLEITGIASTFVPFLPRDGGGCIGPFLDLAVTIQNRGGAFPRKVDWEKRLARIPVAGEQSILTIDINFDFGGGNLGYQQVTLKLSDLPGGTLPNGGAIAVPVHMALASGQKHADVFAQASGAFLLAVHGEEGKTPVYLTKFDIPIWDIYTFSTQTISPPDETSKGKFAAGVLATILNRGGTATPGPVQGSFTVRHEPGGPSLASIQGSTQGPIGPGGSAVIAGQKTVPAKLDAPIIVESQISLLCPDDAAGNPVYGTLADGNADDNARTLSQQ